LRLRHARLQVAAAALTMPMLLSGCVVWGSAETHQVQTIGAVQTTFTACASASAGCPDLGNSEIQAFPGAGQILIGALVPARVGLPATFASTGPEPLAFSQSPSYTAELQRLEPHPGLRWAGYISAVTGYAPESGPQALSASLALELGQGADGSPFAGGLAADLLIGARQVTDAFPAARPVACGASLTALFDEDPAEPTVAAVICKDDAIDFSVPTRDLGILPGAAAAGARPGTLAVLPFSLRYAGLAGGPGAIYNLTATSALSGGALAVTPGAVAPGTDSTSQALVAVGIPPGARPGTYDVTLTARHPNGQTRRGVGRLTVLGGGGGEAGGGATAARRLRLTAVLPRRLRAAAARRKGIAVILGATEPAVARVRLFRGSATAPVASARVRLRVPGPTRVVLRSARLRRGAYRVVITAEGRRLVRRAVLTR
jgi:hypothetical protein